LSGQVAHDEICISCKDPLIAGQNWRIEDVKTSLLYCTKEECQKSKPMTIRTRKNGRIQKEVDPDRGLAQTLKQRRRFIRYPPDAARVAQFAAMIADPRMKNKKGTPRYSRIFKEYGVTNFKSGFTCAEMAVAQYPAEIDPNGCPSIEAVWSVKMYLKRITKRYNGNLEIYSSRGVKETEPHKGSREWRWHALKFKDDLDRQTEEMYKIAKNIELAARKRQDNFLKRPFEERMQKVGILDDFFNEGGA
jgi:hypothetical protein